MTLGPPLELANLISNLATTFYLTIVNYTATFWVNLRCFAEPLLSAQLQLPYFWITNLFIGFLANKLVIISQHLMQEHLIGVRRSSSWKRLLWTFNQRFFYLNRFFGIISSQRSFQKKIMCPMYFCWPNNDWPICLDVWDILVVFVMNDINVMNVIKNE